MNPLNVKACSFVTTAAARRDQNKSVSRASAKAKIKRKRTLVLFPEILFDKRSEVTVFPSRLMSMNPQNNGELSCCSNCLLHPMCFSVKKNGSRTGVALSDDAPHENEEGFHFVTCIPWQGSGGSQHSAPNTQPSLQQTASAFQFLARKLFWQGG